VNLRIAEFLPAIENPRPSQIPIAMKTIILLFAFVTAAIAAPFEIKEGDRVLLLGADGAIHLEVPGLRSIPSAQRRAALLSPDGAARQTRLYAALDAVSHA
jgi:hypothetical protein